MNILTFDIEDWYNHDDYSQDFEWDKFEVRLYEGVDKILEALDRRHLRGTFFCLGWVAEKHPAIIRRIADGGHQIGCHSYQHQLATRFTPAQFAYRVPSFSITRNNLWAFDLLAKLGFRYDCSVFPSQHEFGGIPEFPSSPFLIRTAHGTLKEFPISLGNFLGRSIVYSGGGYFRIMPYMLIKSLMKKSDYVMSYFHPSDFDPGQPPMPHLSRMRQFKNRVGLKNAYSKFQKLIADFDFASLEAIDRRIDWSTVRIINL